MGKNIFYSTKKGNYVHWKISICFCWPLPSKRKQEDKIPRVVPKFVRSPGCLDYFTSAYTSKSTEGGWAGLGQSVVRQVLRYLVPGS